jgi:hypothetical protein
VTDAQGRAGCGHLQDPVVDRGGDRRCAREPPGTSLDLDRELIADGETDRAGRKVDLDGGDGGGRSDGLDLVDLAACRPPHGGRADHDRQDRDSYRIVVRAAEQVVAELEATYQVEVQRGGAELDSELSAGPTVEQVIRLVPALEDAAKLNVVLTDFSGVRVRAGRWHNLDFPSCGCDACDERPDEVAVDLTSRLRAVAAGGLVELLRGGIRPQLTTSLADDEGEQQSITPLSRRELKQMGDPVRHDWQPWPRRSR